MSACIVPSSAAKLTNLSYTHLSPHNTHLSLSLCCLHPKPPTAPCYLSCKGRPIACKDWLRTVLSSLCRSVAACMHC